MAERQWVRSDFNGFFGEFMCLSHHDYVEDEFGARVDLAAGMHLTAELFKRAAGIGDEP